MGAGMITPGMLKAVSAAARDMFQDVGQGHGWDHTARVARLALDFLPDGGDPRLTSLIAMLHDADDYKLFPAASGGTPNADRIMASAGVPMAVQDLVRSELSRFGYSKRLRGLAPETPEGMAVSDADMCDILGASGILRLVEYDLARNAPFFDPADLPVEAITHEDYMSTQSESGCRHMFDKILRLPGLMLTEKGKREALIRRETDIIFLKDLFRERGAAQWDALLDNFLRREKHGPGCRGEA